MQFNPNNYMYYNHYHAFILWPHIATPQSIWDKLLQTAASYIKIPATYYIRSLVDFMDFTISISATKVTPLKVT